MEYNRDLENVLCMRDYPMISMAFMEAFSKKQYRLIELSHVWTIAFDAIVIATCVPLANVLAHLCACVPYNFCLGCLCVVNHLSSHF